MFGMREVTFNDYLEYIANFREVKVEGKPISLEPINVKRLEPVLEELTDISTTIWSFPKRGSWATHKGDYRGNWAPQIPRALILMYTKPGEIVLDSMVGSGTTLIEAKLLGRNSIGVDINYNALILTLHRLYYLEKAIEEFKKTRSKNLTRYFREPLDERSQTTIGNIDLEDVEKAWFKLYHGDSRNLDKLESESVDLIATHPPYFNIIKYRGDRRSECDLSEARSLEEYLRWMKKVAEELFRVLKPGKYCAILIGDTRAHKHYIPISHYILQIFLNVGFILKEEIIKVQHRMKTTKEVWEKIKNRDFLLIYHEKLYVFRKPGKNEETTNTKYSRKLDIVRVDV